MTNSGHSKMRIQVGNKSRFCLSMPWKKNWSSWLSTGLENYFVPLVCLSPVANRRGFPVSGFLFFEGILKTLQADFWQLVRVSCKSESSLQMFFDQVSRPHDTFRPVRLDSLAPNRNGTQTEIHKGFVKYLLKILYGNVIFVLFLKIYITTSLLIPNL